MLLDMLPNKNKTKQHLFRKQDEEKWEELKLGRQIGQGLCKTCFVFNWRMDGFPASLSLISQFLIYQNVYCGKSHMAKITFLSGYFSSIKCIYTTVHHHHSSPELF